MIAENKQRSFLSGGRQEDGSIIIVVLLILAVMTVIGLTAADITVTENYIIRNVGIYKQNVNLVESAAMEGLQKVMQIDVTDPANLDPEEADDDWINSDDEDWSDWYDETTGPQLEDDNSIAADYDADSAMLNARGEADSGNLRLAVLGWEPAPGAELSATDPTRKAGRILAEYVSLDSSGSSNGYGLLRLEIGVERVF